MKTEEYYSTTNNTIKKDKIWFPAIVAYIICFGYIFFGRGFAGLHLPGMPIYIGEILIFISFIYFFDDFFKKRINWFQKLIIFVIIGFSFLFAKDVILGKHELTYIFRDFATAYYIIFLCLFAGVRGVTIFKKNIEVLSKYHFLIALSLLIHTSLGPFLSSFLQIGDDYYGIFYMPEGSVPPLAVFLIIILLEKMDRTKITWLEFISIGISFIAIILTHYRGALIGAMVALAYYIIFISEGRIRVLSKLTIGLCIIAIPAVIYLPIIRDYQEKMFANSEYKIVQLYSMHMLRAKFKSLIDPEGIEYKGDTGAGRIIWWKSVVEDNNESIETFMFGKGFGQNLGESINYGKVTVRGAHNAWVNIYGWSGLSGIILYALALIGTFYFMLKARKLFNSAEHFNAKYACNTGLVYLMAVLVSSMFDNSLSSPATAIPLYIFLGCAVSMVFYSSTLNMQM